MISQGLSTGFSTGSKCSPSLAVPHQPIGFGGEKAWLDAVKAKMSHAKAAAEKKMLIYGNYVDQEAVVHRWGKSVNTLMVLGGAGLTGWHAFQAQPEERKKVIIRDALVLGGAIGGTILSAGGLTGLRQIVQWGYKSTNKTRTGLSKLLMEGLKPLEEEGEKLVARATEVLEKNPEGWGEDFVANLKTFFFNGNKVKFTDDAGMEAKDFSALHDLVKNHVPKEDVSKVFDTLFGEEETLSQEMEEASKFFAVGLLGVLSGIGGGLIANKINGEKDPNKTPNMVKEGVFQFVANIAMCAVGAGLALAAMKPTDWKWEAISKSNAAKAVNQFFNAGAGAGLKRFAGVLVGLSLGIFGGAHIANFVGRHYVGPTIDRIQGREPLPPDQQEKRRIEAMDMVLHLDDVPTAAAIAGTAILGPWIMPFFTVSGYRAGIGYRNDHKTKLTAPSENSKNAKTLVSKPQVLPKEQPLSTIPWNMAPLAPAPSIQYALPMPTQIPFYGNATAADVSFPGFVASSESKNPWNQTAWSR